MRMKDKMANMNIKTKNRWTIFIIFLIGVILLVSTYAWLSTSLNVMIKEFNMVVSKNSGLTISFDGIDFSSSVEISKELLIDDLKKTYPNNLSQWASNGLIPVSSPGIPNSNASQFDIYASGGVHYKNKKKENGFITTSKVIENSIRSFNSYLAFDIFLKNDSGSPIDDNLFLDYSSSITLDSKSTEQIEGLVNSMRVGFVKIGSVPHNASVNEIQNVSCNNNCEMVIYEPNSTKHTETSIKKASEYNVELINGEYYPTFSCIKEGGPVYVKDSVSGSPNLDLNYYGLQNTITEYDFSKPLFKIPNAITKLRIYVWIEGQDIDSLETDSEGADISISIDLRKDTSGYTE